VAVCLALGLLVTSAAGTNTLGMFALPSYPGTDATFSYRGLPWVCALGGASSPAPMQFKFCDGGNSGYLAFIGPATSRLLLVTDAGHDAVHVVDVVHRVHAGYVAAPGTIAGPRGVAARGSLVAVSAWKTRDSGDHVVHLFEGSGAGWSVVRTLAGGFGGPGGADGQLRCPFGLRFTADGTGLAVADFDNGRVTLVGIADGSFVQHVATALCGPFDVEEWEGGWLVACGGSHTVESVVGSCCSGGSSSGGGSGMRASGGGAGAGAGAGGGGGGFGSGDGSPGRVTLGKRGDGHGDFNEPVALTLVPGLGLVVREWGNEGRVQVLSRFL
jgi:hypothetical protein